MFFPWSSASAYRWLDSQLLCGRCGPLGAPQRRATLHAATKTRQFGLALRAVDDFQPVGGAWQRPRGEDWKRGILALPSAQARPQPGLRACHQARTQGVALDVAEKTLARRRAQEQAQDPPDPSKVREQTPIARFPELTSWSDCPIPLTGVLSRDVYADGHEQTWLVVTTAAHWSARHIRDRYGLRTDIEERHRQVKCFWDLTRFHSTAWNLIVSQTVFVCLTYSLLQIHLVQQGHEELNRRTWPTTRRLLPDGDRVIIYRQQYFGFFSLLEHMELTLSLQGKARRKALAKTRRLQREASRPSSDQCAAS